MINMKISIYENVEKELDYNIYIELIVTIVNQKELEFFREELQSRMSSNYNVILKEKKLPLSLLNDHQKVCFVCPVSSSRLQKK